MRVRSAYASALVLARTRLIDYVALAKPELTLLSVLTAVCGGYMGMGAPGSGVRILHVLVGTLLVGGAAGILNQYLEREFDRLMRRTAGRPIAAGRVKPLEGLVLFSVTASLGILYLVVFTTPLAGLLAVATLATYLVLYTPLKRLTPWATFVGGFPGALPPVIGWTAVRGEITVEAGSLFLILFFWQMPHFTALSWMYRNDYARAGYRLLSVLDPSGKRTSRYAFVNTILLVLASIVPWVLGMAGLPYLVAAVLGGSYFMAAATRFLFSPTNAVARSLFSASLLYLPFLLFAMALSRLT
jgi:heme o synthase